MTILTAGDNGGRYNMVHRQTDDGTVISVAMGRNLTPLIFSYKDYLGCMQESLLSASFFPHKRLMRGDCGWREKDDSIDITFSWNASERHVDGFTSLPTGEYEERYSMKPNCALNTRICGLEGHRKVFYRKDREYWTPDHTLQADTEEAIFGFSQYNPLSCPPKGGDKCGIVKFYGECENGQRLKRNYCKKKGAENAFGNTTPIDI